MVKKKKLVFTIFIFFILFLGFVFASFDQDGKFSAKVFLENGYLLYNYSTAPYTLEEISSDNWLKTSNEDTIQTIEVNFYEGSKENPSVGRGYYEEENGVRKDKLGSISAENYPLCRFGGNLNLNINSSVKRGPYSGNPPYSHDFGSYDKNKSLFYCHTTYDLIKSIKIPSSWNNSNLILYCNDAARVGLEYLDYDFILSNLQDTYKACVLKNLDLDSNNTILYGFEVGSTQVENTAKFFFGVENKSGAVSGMGNGVINDSYNETIDYPSTYYIVQATYPSCHTYSCEDEISKEFTTSYGAIPSSIYSSCTSSTMAYGSNSYDCIVHYKNISNQNITINTFKYDVDGKNFFFTYNPYLKYYVLKGFNENLTTNINESFKVPSDFGLSRLALFRQIPIYCSISKLPQQCSFYPGTSSNYDVLGYEKSFIDYFGTSSEMKPEKELKPVFKINFSNSFSPYSNSDIKNLCLDTLSAYNSTNKIVFEETDSINCKDNGVIVLNSYILDTNHDYNSNNVNNKGGLGFTLFKNIILSLVENVNN